MGLVAVLVAKILAIFGLVLLLRNLVALQRGRPARFMPGTISLGLSLLLGSFYLDLSSKTTDLTLVLGSAMTLLGVCLAYRDYLKYNQGMVAAAALTPEQLQAIMRTPVQDWRPRRYGIERFGRSRRPGWFHRYIW